MCLVCAQIVLCETMLGETVLCGTVLGEIVLSNTLLASLSVSRRLSLSLDEFRHTYYRTSLALQRLNKTNLHKVL